MKNKKEENKKIDVQKRLEELDLGEVLEKKANKKRLILIATSILAIIVVAALVTLTHFYGNKAYIRADVKIYSSSKLYSNTEPEDIEDKGNGALFILFIDGIKRDDFLAEYEVTELTINGTNIDLENVTYRHLNNALSIRFHNENYNLEEGNVVIISVKDKNSGQIITKRLYHKTEVL